MVFQDSTNLYHASKYIVDANGDSPYTTIQQAINAANAAAVDAIIIVRDGSYTEDLTLYDGVSIVGQTRTGTIINGTHTPPNAGAVDIKNCTLIDASAIISSAAAGATSITIENCLFEITNGHAVDLANWTGVVTIDNCLTSGTNDGVFTCSSTGQLVLLNSIVGNGAVQQLTLNGIGIIQGTHIQCQLNIEGASVTTLRHCTVDSTLTTAGTATVTIENTALNTGALVAITHNSGNTLNLSNVSIDTSNNPAINGTGTIAIGEVVFMDNSTIAGTITQSNKDILSGDATFDTLTLTGLTQGSVPFVGASGLISEDNSNLFWDDGNNRLGIGTTSPAQSLEVRSGRIRIRESDGAAASGTLELTNGTDTSFVFTSGVADPTAGALNLNTDSAKHVLLQSSAGSTGNVGVNNTGPLSKFGVTGNVAIGSTFGTLSANADGLMVEGRTLIGTSTPADAVLGFGGSFPLSSGIAMDSTLTTVVLGANMFGIISRPSIIFNAGVTGASAAGAYLACRMNVNATAAVTFATGLTIEPPSNAGAGPVSSATSIRVTPPTIGSVSNTCIATDNLNVGSGYVLITPPANGAIIEGKVGVGTSTFQSDALTNDLQLGTTGATKGMSIAMTNSYIRMREKDASNRLALSTNLDTGANQDDATLSSWEFAMYSAAAGDYAQWKRTPPAGAAAVLMNLGADGTFTLDNGVGKAIVDGTTPRIYIGPQAGGDTSSALVIDGQAMEAGTGDAKIFFTETGVAEMSLFYNGAAGAGTNKLFHLRNEISGADFLTTNLNGHFTFQNVANAITAFQVRNSGGTTVLITDTTNQRVGVGNGLPNAKLDVVSDQAADGIFIDNTAADGDPILAWQLSGTSQFTLGVDDGDGDVLKLGTTAIGTSTMFQATAAGEITKPLQPAFLAYNSADDANVTGNGTVATVDFDTEVFDQNSDFAADTFTAPVTGRYRFEVAVQMSNLNGATTSILKLVATSRTVILAQLNPTAVADASGTVTLSGSALIDMAATDTVTVTLTNSGAGADNNTINGSASPHETFFSGCLEV